MLVLSLQYPKSRKISKLYTIALVFNDENILSFIDKNATLPVITTCNIENASCFDAELNGLHLLQIISVINYHNLTEEVYNYQGKSGIESDAKVC